MKRTNANIKISIDTLVKTTDLGLRGVISPYPTVLMVCKDQYTA